MRAEAGPVARILAVVALLLSVPGSVLEAGAKEKRRSCQLLVLNRTPYRVLVHVDGVYWGWVNAQRSFTFRGVPAGDILLYGATQYGEFFWGPKGLRCEGAASWEVGL